MTNIKFDSPKIEEMHDFLMYIYTLGIENSNIDINNGLVYRELCKYGLTKDERGNDSGPLSCRHLFDKWQERNTQNGNDKKDLSLFWSGDWEQFLQYYSFSTYLEFQMKEKFIKLYVPIKYQNMYEDVNKLFDFICESRINHISKVAHRVRSDNVVIRLDSHNIKSAMDIINFVSNNFDSNSIGQVNPFVPTINGIGFTFDYGGTYNGDISILISNYINNCMVEKVKPSIKEFIQYVKEHNTSLEVKKTFKAALGVEEVNISFQESSPKEELFFESLKATYDKYGINQVIEAILSLMRNNDYGMFTNGDKYYRVRMQQLLSEEDVKNIIISNLNMQTNEITRNEITLFCYKILGNDLYRKIHQTCIVTYDKYGKDQLKNALKNNQYFSDYNGFSRFSNNEEDHTNYRELISKIPSKVIMDIIKLSIGIPIIGNNTYSTNKIIESFIIKRIATKHDDIDKDKSK